MEALLQDTRPGVFNKLGGKCSGADIERKLRPRSHLHPSRLKGRHLGYTQDGMDTHGTISSVVGTEGAPHLWVTSFQMGQPDLRSDVLWWGAQPGSPS